MANMDIEAYKYLETVMLPKLDKSMERLINKYAGIMTEHHVQNLERLLELVEKSCHEGNALIIWPEYLGYYIEIWKGN